MCAITQTGASRPSQGMASPVTDAAAKSASSEVMSCRSVETAALFARSFSAAPVSPMRPGIFRAQFQHSGMERNSQQKLQNFYTAIKFPKSHSWATDHQAPEDDWGERRARMPRLRRPHRTTGALSHFRRETREPLFLDMLNIAFWGTAVESGTVRPQNSLDENPHARGAAIGIDHREGGKPLPLGSPLAVAAMGSVGQRHAIREPAEGSAPALQLQHQR